MASNVSDILKYAESLIGIKYTAWRGGSTNVSPHPFYLDEIPSYSYLQEYGVNCAGFVNLLRHKAGKVVPGDGKHKGGTSEWYLYLKNEGVLSEFDYRKNYPIGTLFLRNYRDTDDQGHLAVLFSKYQQDESKVLNGKIIHSCVGRVNSQVRLDNLGRSHFYHSNEYYEYAITPDKWL